MSRELILALLAGASCLGAGIHPAAAIEAGSSEPRVIYANQAAQPVVPVRAAYAERSNMGGGFIEFLFGDGPVQAGRYPQGYPQQPVYQQQPAYDGRRQMVLPWGGMQQADPQ